MVKTLIVLNPHAGNGRAERVLQQIEARLQNVLGDFTLAVTTHPDDVMQHLADARANGATQVISIGGDGTNHVLINALATINEQATDAAPMIYGNLPFGTGRDWARASGIPLKIEAAVEWLAHAQARPVDVGQVMIDDRREFFLNIASAGISGYVAEAANNVKHRYPWAFLQAVVSGIIHQQRKHLYIRLDDAAWYDGRAYAVVVANGTTFGRGMKIAPEAQIDDGLFDVIVVKDTAKRTVLAALWRVYNGSHLSHPAVAYRKARIVDIRSPEGILGMEADGEVKHGHALNFEIRPGLLKMLLP
ncbi:MAG: diacylglycerol kinase family lipid kinase [Chloroflexi bacterium]|nr:MAG: diacylglycerol kinase family lipid kinase [Chloroflexota bacterium]